MINVRVEFDEKRMQALVNLPMKWRRELAKWLGNTATEIKKEARSVLHVRTGHLWRNIGWQIKGEEEMTGEIGTGVGWAKSVVYARIHEFGGDIVPKRAKALTIPMPGVKGVARNYPDAFCVKLKGKPFLAQREGTKLKVLFFLAKRVTIPARPYMRPVLNRKEPELKAAIETLAKEV